MCQAHSNPWSGGVKLPDLERRLAGCRGSHVVIQADKATADKLSLITLPIVQAYSFSQRCALG